MIETFSLSSECVLHIEDSSRVVKKLRRKLEAFDLRYAEKNGMTFSQADYEAGASKTVKSVLEKLAPVVVPLVETKVLWEPNSLEATIHVQMSASYRHVLNLTPSLYQIAH